MTARFPSTRCSSRTSRELSVWGSFIARWMIEFILICWVGLSNSLLSRRKGFFVESTFFSLECSFGDMTFRDIFYLLSSNSDLHNNMSQIPIYALQFLIVRLAYVDSVVNPI